MTMPFYLRRSTTPWRESTVDWGQLEKCLSGKSNAPSKVNWPFPGRPHDPDNLWILYTLRKPGECVRYVGITSWNPALRYQAHRHGGSKAKRAWFAAGPIPLMEIVGSVRGDLRTAMETETVLSHAYQANGCDMLNREAKFSL